jgi:hypothetical protein
MIFDELLGIVVFIERDSSAEVALVLLLSWVRRLTEP